MSEANRKAEIARIQKLIDDARNEAKQNKVMIHYQQV